MMSMRSLNRSAAPRLSRAVRLWLSRPAALCLCAAVLAAPPAFAQSASQDKQSAPTLKKPDKVEVAPSRTHRSYDAAHDTTYVNVDITLLARNADEKLAGGALAFAGREVTLTFQFAYSGKRTDDMTAAYLILESTTAPDQQGDHLSAARHLDINADAYRYAYERADYKTTTATTGGAAQKGAPPLKREMVVFRLPVEDLPEIANANRVELNFGTEVFTLKSMQLIDLRRTLITGDKH
jgi:hypothetical protein